MKKIAIISLCLGLVSPLFASGIKGSVSDSNGKPKANVSIKCAGYSNTVKTSSNGTYQLDLPASANGKRLNVYVNGKFAVNCLVPPEDDCFSKVDVVYER